MKTMKALTLVAICSFLLLAGGCAWWNDLRGKYDEGKALPEQAKATGELPQVSGGMVLPVNKELITMDEVVTPLIEDLKPMADGGDYLDFRVKAKPMISAGVEAKVSNIVLYQKAKKEAREGIDEPLAKAADAEVRQFVAGFDGNYAAAEKAIKRMGMTWKTFLDYQKKMLMVQSFLNEEFKDKKPVSFTDMVNYYNKVKDEQFHQAATVQFRVIDIMPNKVSLRDPNQTRRQRASELAAEVMAKLAAGEQFAPLAKQYSSDTVKGELGGLWSPVTVGSLAKPYDMLENAALTLTPGKVAGPIEAPDHIFIVQLENKRDANYEPFEKVQHEVEMAIKFKRKRDSIDILTNKLTAQADVGDKQTFIELCLQRAYQQIK